MKLVNLNVEYIKEQIKAKGIRQIDLGPKLGHNKSYVSSAFYSKTMPQAEFSLLCLLIGADEKKARMTSGGEKKEQTSDENCEIIVSYIQDLGKIETEMLRQMRDEHEAVMKVLNEISETLKDLKAEEHRDSQQVLNYMKYGRK